MTVVRNAPRLVVPAAAIVALLSGTAVAQAPSGGGGGNPLMPRLSIGDDVKRKLTPEEQERQDALDAAYKAATKKIPDQKAADPWATVRPSPQTAAQNKKPQ